MPLTHPGGPPREASSGTTHPVCLPSQRQRSLRWRGRTAVPHWCYLCILLFGEADKVAVGRRHWHHLRKSNKDRGPDPRLLRPPSLAAKPSHVLGTGPRPRDRAGPDGQVLATSLPWLSCQVWRGLCSCPWQPSGERPGTSPRPPSPLRPLRGPCWRPGRKGQPLPPLRCRGPRRSRTWRTQCRC